ncbi:hypothetical protein MAM1_0159d06897 [Mucor ambiguus]|uniref:PH domain-containing protein n=1 Tax=Mucor ambiguus TaxID=91626 RepID=A0A0C9LVU8_9FUNG|nr:hypothetical protein MAM1_0159d06897 [Mucor ambiguus]
MPDQVLHTLEEHPTFIPLITTDSVSSRSKVITSSDESIQSDFLSPFTAATDAATSNATAYQINQSPSDVHEDDLFIPVHEEQRYVQKDQVLMQGLVLCTRTAQWYTKKKSTTRELQLRKTRLRWRQFKAVLRPDKIELYHVTTSATVASFDTRLHLVPGIRTSSNQVRCVISFPKRKPIRSTEMPVPAFVDIQVMIDTPMQVRLPLDYVLKHTKDTLLNIHIQDIKPVIRSLLQKENLLHTANWLRNDFRLCWRPIDVSNKRTSTVITSGDRIEWLAENTVLIGPQLIEQRHVLELHTSEEPVEKWKPERRIFAFDSLLINKMWTKSGRQQKIKCKKSYFYVVLYGHHLFFFDGPYYYYYKRQAQRQENQRQREEQSKQKKQNNWFSATTGLLLQQRKLIISKENKKRIYELGNQSSPHFKYASPESVPLPDPTKLVNAHLLLDLHRVTRVQPMLQKGTQHASSNTFEIHIDGTILYYEAPSTQIMLQWVTLISNMIKVEHLLVSSSLSYRHHRGYDGNKSILQSGFLYVKQDFRRSFQPQYCVLTKSENYDGLIMFDTFHKNPDNNHNLFNCMSNPSDDGEHIQQRKELLLYQKKRVLLYLKDAYVYSGDECILDKYEQEKVEPLRFYKDGIVTGGSKTSECIFVIWQIAKRRFVPNVREYMSIFKLGHRLGNRGRCWVFKARSKQERDEWVEALSVEFGLLSGK